MVKKCNKIILINKEKKIPMEKERRGGKVGIRSESGNLL